MKNTAVFWILGLPFGAGALVHFAPAWIYVPGLFLMAIIWIGAWIMVDKE